MLMSQTNLDYTLDGVLSTRLTFAISLYSDRPLSTFASELVAVWEKFRTLVGDKCFRVYATDTMRQHKSVTARVLGMLKDPEINETMYHIVNDIQANASAWTIN